MNLHYVADATFFKNSLSRLEKKMKNKIEEYLSDLKNMPMFNGIETPEMGSMFHCLGAYMKDIKKG